MVPLLANCRREIKEFSAADIIVILRNPIDMMYAQHSQLLFQRQEEIVDFKEALAAESERRQGHRIPRGSQRVESFFYGDAARFSQQLERYFDVFGREKVHVILYDDLRADTPLVYRRMLEFLGVDPVFTPSFEVHNCNKRMRFTLLQDLVYRPPLVGRLIPKLRRYRIMHALRKRIIALHSREAHCIAARRHDSCWTSPCGSNWSPSLRTISTGSVRSSAVI